MWTGESHWSIAFIVSAIALILILALCIGAWIVGTYLGNDPNGYDRDFNRKLWHYGAIILATITIGAYAFAWFPYQGEYHQYQKISGNVATVNKRLVSSGDNGMEEKLVVTYDSGIQVGCLDTRCASLKPGDTLTMNCIRRYEWFSTSGYDCRFVGIE